MAQSGSETAPSFVGELLQLLALSETALRPEAVRAYFDGLRTALDAAQDEAFLKEFAALKTAFRGGLNHEAQERAQGLLRKQPENPLLVLLLAQTCQDLKQLPAAAAHLYHAERLGLPEEIMLIMKARYCEAAADGERSTKLRSQLQEIIEAQEAAVRAVERAAHASVALSYAWGGVLAGFAAALVGVGGILVHPAPGIPFFFGALAFLGGGGLLTATWYVWKFNRILAEARG